MLRRMRVRQTSAVIVHGDRPARGARIGDGRPSAVAAAILIAGTAAITRPVDFGAATATSCRGRRRRRCREGRGRGGRLRTRTSRRGGGRRRRRGS
jgi:hypothetical protein